MEILKLIKDHLPFEAMKYTGGNGEDFRKWLSDDNVWEQDVPITAYKRCLCINNGAYSLETYVSKGGWLVRDKVGNLYAYLTRTFNEIFLGANLSHSQKQLRAMEVSRLINPKIWLARNADDKVLGFITEAAEGFNPLDGSISLTASELRELADLVDEMMEKEQG